MQNEAVRRLIYVSQAAGNEMLQDHRSILISSSRNNGIDGVTGVLWVDGRRYLQVLEGPSESVAAVFDRITRDDRHSDIVIIEDAEAQDRVFGDWAMAGLPDDRPANTEDRLRLLLRNAPAEVTRHFPTLAE